MYQVRVINKDKTVSPIYSSKSYDRALNKFVKVVAKQEEVPLKKNELIKVQIVEGKTIYLENCIRGYEQEGKKK